MKRQDSHHYLRVLAVFRIGSDAKPVLLELQGFGAPGFIAADLIRAAKASSYAHHVAGDPSRRGPAFQHKRTALEGLTKTLMGYAVPCRIRWGWAVETARAVGRAKHFLYIDLPSGQVSFHTEARGEGPAYSSEYRDQERGADVGRICRYAAGVLATQAALPL